MNVLSTQVSPDASDEVELLACHKQSEREVQLRLQGLVYQLASSLFSSIKKKHGSLLENRAPKGWVRLDVHSSLEIDEGVDKEAIYQLALATVKKALTKRYPDLSVVASAAGLDNHFFMVDFSTRRENQPKRRHWCLCC